MTPMRPKLLALCEAIKGYRLQLKDKRMSLKTAIVLILDILEQLLEELGKE